MLLPVDNHRMTPESMPLLTPPPQRVSICVTMVGTESPYITSAPNECNNQQLFLYHMAPVTIAMFYGDEQTLSSGILVGVCSSPHKKMLL